MAWNQPTNVILCKVCPIDCSTLVTDPSDRYFTTYLSQSLFDKTERNPLTMASQVVVVFQALAFEPPATLVADLEKQDGYRRAFFGQKMEDPETGILCTEWSSSEAALRYRSSPLASSLEAKETLAFALSSERAPRGGSAVFEAPCTEVFTAFGVEEGFADNVGRFVEKVDAEAPVGYKGAAYGEGVRAEGDDGEEVVRVLIGWTSKEAHFEAKERPGVLRDNIHELRTLRRTVDLFHVAFKEL
ncbi:hypothetical protein VTK56DRAFT_7875 [Thermocarpiscus australiensis]